MKIRKTREQLEKVHFCHYNYLLQIALPHSCFMYDVDHNNNKNKQDMINQSTCSWREKELRAKMSLNNSL